MPYLQLDVINDYPISTKKLLAKRIGEVYSTIMDADVNKITVSIRCLGIGSLWRCSDEEPTIGAILMCDIRAGRSQQMRAELSKALISLINEQLGLEQNQLNIEFTQHPGDEMYHQRLGGFSADWAEGETYC